MLLNQLKDVMIVVSNNETSLKSFKNDLNELKS